jgi:hypothetical protein
MRINGFRHYVRILLIYAHKLKICVYLIYEKQTQYYYR